MKSKSDNIEIENRVRCVQEWLMSGHNSTDIIKQCATKFNVCTRQAQRYIDKAYDGFCEIKKRGVKKRLAFHIETRMKLLRDLENKKSPSGTKTSLDILDSMAKLEGVLIDKHEVTGKDGGPIEALQTVVILPSNGHESKE